MIYRKQSDKNLSDHLNYEFVKWLIACVNGDSKYGFKIRLLLALVLFTAPIVIKIMGFEKIIDWSFLELRFYFYLNFYIYFIDNWSENKMDCFRRFYYRMDW